MRGDFEYWCLLCSQPLCSSRDIQYGSHWTHVAIEHLKFIFINYSSRAFNKKMQVVQIKIYIKYTLEFKDSMKKRI